MIMMDGNPGDVVAVWQVKLADGPHKIVLEHGGTSGKRVISVDGEEVLRKNWMFRLVGSEGFKIGTRVAEVEIKSSNFTTFEYTLKIDGKTLKQFIEAQIKNTRTWLPELKGESHRVVLDIATMDVYADGHKLETCGEFTETGVETHFTIGRTFSAIITSESSGNARKGLLYKLLLENGTSLEPIKEH